MQAQKLAAETKQKLDRANKAKADLLLRTIKMSLARNAK
jgi:hypothetical protein